MLRFRMRERRFVAPSSAAERRSKQRPITIHSRSRVRPICQIARLSIMLASVSFSGLSNTWPTQLMQCCTRQAPATRTAMAYSIRRILYWHSAAGAYEKDRFVTWVHGDWNGDGRFESGDLVLALQQGTYTANSIAQRGAVLFAASVLDELDQRERKSESTI